MENEIGKYIDLYGRLNSSVGDKDVALEILRQVGKDTRVRAMQDADLSRNGRGNGATPRQRAFLEARGISTAGLSKAEASEKIDEVKSQEAR